MLRTEDGWILVEFSGVENDPKTGVETWYDGQGWIPPDHPDAAKLFADPQCGPWEIYDGDFEDFPISPDVGICWWCKRYQGNLTCDAYPGGIPEPFILADAKHTTPDPNGSDKGLTFDPVDGYTEEPA